MEIGNDDGTNIQIRDNIEKLVWTLTRPGFDPGNTAIATPWRLVCESLHHRGRLTYRYNVENLNWPLYGLIICPFSDVDFLKQKESYIIILNKIWFIVSRYLCHWLMKHLTTKRFASSFLMRVANDRNKLLCISVMAFNPFPAATDNIQCFFIFSLNTKVNTIHIFKIYIIFLSFLFF